MILAVPLALAAALAAPDVPPPPAPPLERSDERCTSTSYRTVRTSFAATPPFASASRTFFIRAVASALARARLVGWRASTPTVTRATSGVAQACPSPATWIARGDAGAGGGAAGGCGTSAAATAAARASGTANVMVYPTFWNFAFGAPQIGHFSGGTPNSTSPHTGQR